MCHINSINRFGHRATVVADGNRNVVAAFLEVIGRPLEETRVRIEESPGWRGSLKIQRYVAALLFLDLLRLPGNG